MKQAFLLSAIIILASCHITSAASPAFNTLGTRLQMSELDVGRDGDPAGTGWNSAPCWMDFGPFTSGDHTINRDGLKDLFIGDKDGNVWFYENIGTEKEPVVDTGFRLQMETADGPTVNVGHNATPFLIDWDRDCDLDLIVGNSKGTFYYYENKLVDEVHRFQTGIELSRGPVLVAQTSTVGSAQDIFVIGKYAYVAAGEMGLQIFDISNPYKPSLVGGFDSAGSAQGVFVRGNYAYLADGKEGLRVVDITDPKSPKETGGLVPRNPQGVKKPQDSIQPGATDVYVVGNYAFVACGIGGLQIVDVTDPTKPNAGKDDRHGFDVPIGGIANGVYVVGNHVYVACGNAGLQVLEVRDFFPTVGTTSSIGTTGSNGIFQLGVVDTPGCAMDVWINPDVSARYVYVADEKGGLQIIDVGAGFTVSNTTMADAALVPNSISFEDAQNVFVKRQQDGSTIAYVSDGANGFQMVDVTDPTTPVRMPGASYNTKDYTSAVWVQDNYIYAADRMAGMAIFDDYNPPNLQARNFVSVNAFFSTPHIFDLDEDGFCDMLSGDEHGYVWFFHNQGALSNPSFNDGFRIRGSSSSGLLDAGQYSTPWIVDWNGDGIKDLIVGNETGNVLFYEGYETIPLPTDSIEGLIPLATRNRYLAFKPAKTIKVSGRDIDVGRRSCPMVGDWNNDNGLDLIIGNEDGKLSIFLNTKTWPGEEPSFNASFNVREQLTDKHIDSPLQLGEFSVPFVVDWDNDHKKDLIIGDVDGFVTYFRNSGTNTNNPKFSSGFRPQRTGPQGMMDVKVDGGYAVPVAFDWDMDGSKDLIVGDFHGKVWFFRNIGTDAAPVFGTPTQMLSNNTPLDVGQYAAPFVCDWNHDGQKDLIVGNENGYCLLFPNISTANGTQALGTSTILRNIIGDIDVGRFARPWVVDYNVDWLDDLIVGNGDGNIKVYLNIGNEQKPEYGSGENETQTIDTQITDIDAGVCAAPCITDWNNDETLDLLSGNKEGIVWLFTSATGTAIVWIDESITLKTGVYDWPAFRYNASRDGNDPTETLIPPLDLYWPYGTGSSVVSSPVVLGGTVAVCSKDGVISCIDTTGNGSITKKITTSFDSTPIMVGENIYVAGHDGIIRCLNLGTLAEQWAYQTNGSIQWSSPMIVNGRLYIGCSDERLYCLSADTGEFLWSYKTGGRLESSPTVVNGRVYFGSMDGRVYCLDAVNGALKWEYNIGSAIHSTACIRNNILYVGADNGRVYAIKTDTGGLLWSSQASKGSSPAIDTDTLYFGGEDGCFYAMEALTGKAKWSYYIGSPIHSSPIVANGIIFVGADNGTIYALSTEANSRNRLIWSYQTKGKVSSSPAVAGNRLFVASEDGNCYIFGPKRFLGSSKTASVNGPVPPGGTLSYTINISNAIGTNTVSVIDELDASLINPVNISGNGTTTTQNGQTVIIWNNIDPQSVNLLRFDISVSSDALPGAIINNTARIEWTAGSYTIPNVHIRVAGTVTTVKRMIPAKQEFSPGEAIEYTITCKNIMGTTIHKLTISDEINSKLTAIVPLNNGVYDDKTRRITWQIGESFANGKELTVGFRANVLPTAPNKSRIMNNTASFWSIDTGGGSVTAVPGSVTIVAPDFGQSNRLASPNVVRSGAIITYDITYTNSGTMATDVIVVDKVDNNLSVVSPSISQLGVYDPDYHLITWRLGQIEANKSGTLSYKAIVNSPIDNKTQITNNAAISCRQMETPYPVVGGTVTADNRPEFNYSSIDVSPRDGTGPYDVMEYTITCVNSGDATATTTMIVDSLSSYLSLGSLTSQEKVASVDLHGNWNQFDSGLVDGNITIRTNNGTYTSKEINLANYPNVLTLQREINTGPAKVTLRYDQDRFILECRNNGHLIELKETGLLPFFSCIKIPPGVYCDSMARYDTITRDLSWDIGDIPAGSSTTLRFKAQLLPGIGTVTNNAIIYWGTASTGTGTYRIDPVYTNVDISPPIVGLIPVEGTIANQDEDADIDGAYTIFWKQWYDNESGVGMYCLQEGVDMKNWGTVSDSISGTQLSYNISGKGKGNTYYYRLKARNHAGFWSDFTPSSDGIKIVDSFGVVKAGTISTVTKDRCRVSIPNDAFVDNVTFVIRKVTNPAAIYAPGMNSAIFNESIVELTALPEAYYGSNTQPIKPITLTLPYPDPDTFNEAEDYNYRIFKLTGNEWRIVPGSQVVSPVNDTITVNVPSLSFYAVARVDSSVDNIVVKPNPVRGNTSVKFCNASGNIWIYNTAGELVRTLYVTGGEPEWDTKNSNGEPVASGIYVCVIENEQKERVTRVIGIIR
ncbi:PQQ-binding-like beta-propeller repeat protein [Candidatus Desantisbacteria bacterium]|nr:PQQ-binding-like beta-propeller repeat protein [Candidatus Desantisbacteria bacterium]